MRVTPEPSGMDEFGSEHPHAAGPAAVVDGSVAAIETPSASTNRTRDERAFHIVTAIAIVEAVVLIVAGVSLSGLLGTSSGMIVVDSVPAAAEVRIDGEVAGVTPLSITAAAGRHAIEVRHQGNAQAMTVPVARGQTTHSLVEFPASSNSSTAAVSEIRITSEPAAAQVSIDGVVRGATPLVVPGLTPGSHVVSVRGGGSQTSRSIDVAAGAPQSLHILLPETSDGPGWISVGGPMALRVFDGSRLVGTSGAGPIALAAGVHELDFVNDEMGVRLHHRVTVRPDMTTAVMPSLPRGSLTINAQPWAEVWLNGERVGETPLGNLSLPVGRYEVLLRHPELGERKTRVLVTTAAPARVSVDMVPRPGAP